MSSYYILKVLNLTKTKKKGCTRILNKNDLLYTKSFYVNLNGIEKNSKEYLGQGHKLQHNKIWKLITVGIEIFDALLNNAFTKGK